jgi:hypothetical protein
VQTLSHTVVLRVIAADADAAAATAAAAAATAANTVLHAVLTTGACARC